MILIGAVVAAILIGLQRHARRAMDRQVPGGILIANAARYDAMSHRLLLGSFFDRIAVDVADAIPDGGRVLEVGCGPGRLSILLARRGLDVTGIDLDPTMVERARANARRTRIADGRTPSYLVGDVASLPFPDRSFDLVVSTLSMHHWADPTAGLDEIARLLRPRAHALVWDLRARIVPFHGHMPDPVEAVQASSLRVLGSTPWRWPWRLPLTQRIELVRAMDAQG